MAEYVPTRRHVSSVTSEPPYAEIVQRWDAFWSLQDLGRPLWMSPTSPVLTAAMTGLVPIPQLLQDLIMPYLWPLDTALRIV